MHVGNFPCLFGSSWYTYLDTIQLIIVAFLQLVKIVLLPILTVFSIRFLSVIRYPHQKHEVQWKNGCFRFRISCLSASMTSLNELSRYIFQFLLIFLFCVQDESWFGLVFFYYSLTTINLCFNIPKILIILRHMQQMTGKCGCWIGLDRWDENNTFIVIFIWFFHSWFWLSNPGFKFIGSHLFFPQGQYCYGHCDAWKEALHAESVFPSIIHCLNGY